MNKNYYPTGWWIIASSKELKKGSPLALRRFGINLVLWRTQDGKAAATEDLCPHRSVRLSLGRINQDCIECPFHGLQFRANGECHWVPEINRAAPQIKVRSFEIVEFESYLWIWWSNGEPHVTPVGKPEWFQELPPGFIAIDRTDIALCHITRAIENQLDFSHLSFVHRKTIGRFSDPKKSPTFHLTETQVSYSMAGDKDRPPFICYKKPNLWLNAISPSFMMTIGFVPVDETTTKFYMRTYQNFVRWPGLSLLVLWMINKLNRKILLEDLRLVNTHPAGTSLEFEDKEKLLASDRAIRHFRELWKQ